jgi:protein-S-isoprenylcysteine O-methyltransferase Ste14
MQMTNDLARIIILLGVAVVLPFGIYHRLRSHTDERLDRRQEGWLVLVSLRPLALVFMTGLVAFLLEPSSMAWATCQLPSGVRWAGVGFGVGATVLIYWTFRSLGHNLTDTVVARRDAELVTHGPYRWVRHPLYLATALGVIATTLTTDNGLLAVTGTAAFGMIVVRTSIEEQVLIQRFGDEYLKYMRRTGRFLPRLRINA